MVDRPILFSAPMVQALLDGRKTQTRRVAKFVEVDGDGWEIRTSHGGMCCCDEVAIRHYGPSYAPYAVGDRIYVREEYYQRGHWEPALIGLSKGGKQKWYFAPADDAIRFEAPDEYRKARSSADPGTIAWHKRLGRFMPRRYSRLTLMVTDVRVERLQDCSEADAIAEGIVPAPMASDMRWKTTNEGPCLYPSAVAAYAALWNSINGPGAWEANPWVVAVSFEVRRGNIDQQEQTS